ncbi:LysE/ArgO family amino acid transporter [Helicobacter jaachi]|uniref:LysE/ArgO family amino acid transporter n=1 Tax=Helicobacter jaachi TaxID=1677920 RepID=UPI000ABC062C|nr:LysE/ArgO family amino acid transporter [Helicobacter jaachi]
MFIPDFLQGFLISFGLFSAIGAQNAFVIKQAIKKEHTFAVCALCVACDVVLISVGVLGFGTLFSESSLASKLLAILGALFLAYLGYTSLKSALFASHALNINVQKTHSTLKQTLYKTLAITLLNPHVYLDTIVLLGSIGVSAHTQAIFLFGCISASVAWFALLGFGANALSPLFSSQRSWRILEGIVACVMLSISLSLVIFAIKH